MEKKTGSRRISMMLMEALAFVFVMSAVVLPIKAFGATVSKTFTTHGSASDVLTIFGQESFTFSVTGSYIGTVKLQKSKNNRDWQDNTTVTTSSHSLTHFVEDAPGRRVFYRVYCSTHSEGSIVTALADVNDIYETKKNLKQVDAVTFKDDGLVLAGTLSVAGATTLTGALSNNSDISVTGAIVRVASNSSSGLPFDVKGAFSSTEISLLSGANGDVVYNSTLFSVCGGTGTVASLGAYVLPRSTSTTATLVPCY